MIQFAAPICKPGLLQQPSHLCMYTQQILSEFSFPSGTAWQEIQGSALGVLTVVHITLHNTDGPAGHMDREAFRNLSKNFELLAS